MLFMLLNILMLFLLVTLVKVILLWHYLFLLGTLGTTRFTHAIYATLHTHAILFSQTSQSHVQNVVQNG